MKNQSKGMIIFAYVMAIAFSICCIIPLINVIMISVSSESSIKEFGYRLIPDSYSLAAYKTLFESPGTVINAYGITILTTVVGTVIGVLIGGQYAYALTRHSFVLKRQMAFYIYFTMLFSGGVVPTYILVTQYLHMKNSILALIIPYMVSQYNIFLIRTFFQSIPHSLYEAAKIDGAGEYTILYKIIYPMSTGIIATVTLFTALGFWNSWYPCLLYINDSKLYSLQYMLYVVLGRIQFLNLSIASGLVSADTVPEDSLRMATCIVAIGPLIVAFPFFQKYFVKGVSVGAVKG